MSVHYKFKSTLNFDTIAFDGLHISVADLKKAIVSQKRLGKMSDFDLQITNAQTKEEYFDDTTLIPKNTSLIIARIPLAQQPKRSWDTSLEKPNQTRSRLKQDSAMSLDISKMQGSEEEKIREMMLQSTADYDPKSYQRTKGHYQSGEVPVTYRCNKCKKGGHWIKNCPLGSSKDHVEVKRTTGIPRSFRDKDPLMGQQEVTERLPVIETKTAIPEDLLCSICNDLFTDAVMIPCCGSSFCDDCVRTALLESEDNECPDCGEKGSSPGALIPNRFIRNSVNSFKNETGYSATTIKKDQEKSDSAGVIKAEEVLETDAVSDEVAIITKAEEEPLTETVPNTNVDNLLEKSDTKVEIEVKESKESGEEDVKEKASDLPVSAVKDEAVPPGEVESDFEDNIVVTMPLSQVENQQSVFRERPYNDRRPHSVKTVEQEMTQKIPKIAPMNMNNDNYGAQLPPRNTEWDRKYEHNYKEQTNKDIQNLNQIGCIPSYPNPNAKPIHMMPSYPYCDMGQRPIRPLNMHEMLPDGMNRGNMYPQHNRLLPGQGPPVHGPPIGPFQNPYGQILTRPTVGYNQFIPPDVRNDCMGYGPPRNMTNDNNLNITSGSLASVYQGVAEKVGTGIIDDPLEAFNRIMKEKEKRKEARCRSSERHQSRSNDHHHPPRNRFRTSPYDYEKTREHYSKERKERSIDRERERRERRDYGRNNERSKADKGYARRRHSNSFSDKSTRSRSRSNSVSKKHSISPHKRRSRSYKRTTEEKYHRSEKPRNEPRNQNMRSIKESSPPKTLYESVLEYQQQPPPPGFEMNITMAPSNTWPLNKRDNDQESNRRRDGTPPRALKRVIQSPSKMNERKRIHSRSISPQISSTLIKYQKREHDNVNEPVEDQEARSINNGTQKTKTDKNKNEKRSNSVESKAKTAEINLGTYKSEKPEKLEDEWQLNDSDRISVESKKDGKREKSESKRDKKVKDRKKRRKEKTQRKKTKKDKRDKHELSDKEKDTKKDSNSPDLNVNVDNNNTSKESLLKQAYDSQNSILNQGAAGDIKNTVHKEANGNNVSNTNCLEKTEVSAEDSNVRKEKENYDDNIGEPELSKWERDEVNSNASNLRKDDIFNKQDSDEKNTITNEVLRKAENVIFAKAENSIRPLETKKGVCERPKGRSPKPHIGGNIIENIQIIVPLTDEHKKRRSRSGEPNPSIKERLGSKIVTNNAFSLKNNNNLKRHGSMDTGDNEEPKYRNKFRDPRTPRRDVRDRCRDIKSSVISQHPSSSSGNRTNRTKRNAFATYDDIKRKSRDESRDDKVNNRGNDRERDRDRERERERERERDRRSKDRSYATHKSNTSNNNNNNNNNNSTNKKDNTKRIEEDRGKFDRYQRYNSVDKNKKNERKHTDSFRRSEEKRSFDIDKASMSASSGSESDSKSNDCNKRKKKHKSKKDKKRVKRSTSVDSFGSSSKQSRNKKKTKSNRKNKKNKK